MIAVHHDHALAVRLAMAFAMVLSGVLAFVWPRCFAGVAGYFTRWAHLDPAERERVDRVVEAREAAEGISTAYGRFLGVTALALAGLEMFRAVPYILPYALFCLVVATVTLLAYLQFHRASEQRVAALVRRSPFTALPPLLIAAIGCSFVVSLALATYQPDRVGALIVAASTIVLGVIAWRIADAPALLLGVDPQCEYAVDEHVRIGRARSVALLACAPGFVLAAIAEPSLSDQFGLWGRVAMWILTVAFVITFAASILPLRRRIRVA